jgi:branched-chain amino acid aminotransferase
MASQIQYIILDGELVEKQSALTPIFESRSGKYGDGFFETIHFFDSKLLYFHLHHQRLTKTARLLKFDLPEHWNETFFEDKIAQLARANNVEFGRVSIQFRRDTEGYYLPLDKRFRFHISIEKQQNRDAVYELNEKGLVLGEYRELTKTSNFTSGLKTCNALIYVLASMHAKIHQFDECLIFNEEGRVAEGVSSNIIIVKQDTIVTPPFSEYGIDGVMKKVIMQKAAAYGYKTEEYAIYAEDLFSSDEVWFCNVMQGLRWVGEYRGKVFQNAVAKNLSSILSK